MRVTYVVVRKPWCSTNFLSINSVGSKTKNLKLMKTLPNRHHRHNWPRIVVRDRSSVSLGGALHLSGHQCPPQSRGSQPQEPGLCSSLVKRVGLDEVLLSFTARSRASAAPREEGTAFSQHDALLHRKSIETRFSFPLAPSFGLHSYPAAHHLPLAMTCPMNKCWVLGKGRVTLKPPWSASQTASQRWTLT